MTWLNEIILITNFCLIVYILYALRRARIRRAEGEAGVKPVYGIPSESRLADYGIGSFVWYINGENEVLWDKGSMSAFGMEMNHEADWYKVPYTEWVKLVASEEELQRLQAVATEGIASLRPYHMWGMYVEPKTGKLFKVLSWGTAEKILKDGNEVTKCCGVNVRIPDGADMPEHRSFEVMARLTRMSDTIARLTDG